MSVEIQETVGEIAEAVTGSDFDPQDGGNAFIALHTRLISLESKEAAASLGKKVGLFLGATVAIFFAYCLIVVGLTGWLAGWLSTQGDHVLAGFPGAALIVAFLHLAAGVMMILAARKLPKVELFEFTKRELKKDVTWLKNKIAEKQKKS